MKRILRVAFCVVPLLDLIGCDADRAEPPQSVIPPSVTVVQVKRGDVVRSITLPGDLVGFYEAALHAKVSGYLNSISVDKGDTVTQGQVLAEIEVPELQQKLKRARANLEIQRLTRERLQRVWNSDKRLVAREDVDIAESKFEQAQADVEELEALVNYTHIVAPFDGVVTGRFVDPGALIQAGGSETASASQGSAHVKGNAMPVVSVAAISKLRVYVYVPETETSDIHAGIPATLILKEFPGRTFTGSVARFAKSLDLSTRTMLTEVDLDNAEHVLYPGMYADVRLELARHPDALQLPTTAIGSAEADGHSFVYVVRDNRLKEVPVTLGISNEGWIEISAGLNETERVVKNLNASLQDGEQVSALLTEAPAPGSPAVAGAPRS
ncbi:MAG: efflux RND transporter periplasmic adaptor subunit [Candidatus Binatia bacterium]